MKNNIVSQHTNLINARYKLSLNEKRLILCAISKINPTKKVSGDLIVELKISDIMEIFDGNKDNYTYFIELAKGLRKKDFPIEKLEDGSLISVGWFSRAIVDTKGILKIKIDETIVPYLSELKEYTKYKLENVSCFKNPHTFRIYELCKQYEGLRKRRLDVDELKSILQLKSRYKRFVDFRRYVLDIAVEEINGHSDIQIDYKPIKKGRAYKSLDFMIKPKGKNSKKPLQIDTVKVDPLLQANIQALKQIIKPELTDEELEAILSIADNDISKVVEKYYLVKNNANISNLTGLLIDSIRKDYKEPKKANEGATMDNQRKTNFHFEEQRSSRYTHEELEAILLENQKKKQLER